MNELFQVQRRTARMLFLAALAVAGRLAPAWSQSESKPVAEGQRVFSAGHSFHMFMPDLLNELATSAGISDHVVAGRQSIGGSRVIQHWDLADDRNLVKPALHDGKIDVLTLSPI